MADSDVLDGAMNIDGDPVGTSVGRVSKIRTVSTKTLSKAVTSMQQHAQALLAENSVDDEGLEAEENKERNKDKIREQSLLMEIDDMQTAVIECQQLVDDFGMQLRLKLRSSFTSTSMISSGGSSNGRLDVVGGPFLRLAEQAVLDVASAQLSTYPDIFQRFDIKEDHKRVRKLATAIATAKPGSAIYSRLHVLQKSIGHGGSSRNINGKLPHSRLQAMRGAAYRARAEVASALLPYFHQLAEAQLSLAMAGFDRALLRVSPTRGLISGLKSLSFSMLKQFENDLTYLSTSKYC